MMQQMWYDQRWKFLKWCFIPFSWLYLFFIYLRRLAYRLNLFKSYHFSVPIVVVGNITVGGTGKTPLVIALANHFTHRGRKVGIVSRGYKGSTTSYPFLATEETDPKLVGDESVLIARSTHCPVMVDPKRPRAVSKLMKEWQCDLILSDDGLQHYALNRDLEIAVVDGKRQFGNKQCLPAGPLREPFKRIKAVDIVVVNGVETVLDSAYQMKLLPGEIYQLINPNNKFHIIDKTKNMHAIVGIGNPMRFFNTLQEMGFSVVEHAFPDHYEFKFKDIDFGKQEIIIMTEKDAVKCIKFADERHWCLPVTAELPDVFYQSIENSITPHV